MIEKWKSVVGYEGYYEVSHIGNVRSLERVAITKNGHKQPIKAKSLSLCPNNRNYYIVMLSGKNAGGRRSVHRLVAEAFTPNPENKKTVNHIDGNKQNNHVDNLEWMTYSDNNKHAFSSGLKKPSNVNKNGNMQGEKQAHSKLKESDVRYIRINCIKNGGKLSSLDLGVKFGVTRSNILAVISRKTWKHVI